MSRTEIRHSPSPPNQLDRNELHIQHAPGSANIEGIWAGNKVDEARVIVSYKVVHAGDGNDHTILPEERYTGMDSNSAPVTATLPDPSKINDGHEVLIDDEGGLAGTNAITIATPGAETTEVASIGTNDGKAKLMWDETNSNWVDVS